jgi:casein kinase 1
MNYVRKLGFEENPDYDFLRELFTKVLRTLGEPEDGVYDWMLLNNGKGWEASNVRFFVVSLSMTLNPLQGHSSRDREREHRREHGRRSRQPVQDGSTPNGLLVSPAPAHMKTRSRQAGDRHRDRDASNQQIPPQSRRTSQQRDLNSAIPTPHPYATAPSPNGFKSQAAHQYGRHSPYTQSQQNANGQNGSESFLYGQGQTNKYAANSRDGTGTPRGDVYGGGAKSMGLYDRQQMHSGVDDDIHGKRKGFWASLCCRG